MQITEITVHASRTLPHPIEDYANIRPSVTLKAVLEGDDPVEATKELQRKAEMLVEEHAVLLRSSLRERDVLEREAQEIRQLESSMHRQTQRLEELKDKHEKASTPDWLTFPAKNAGAKPIAEQNACKGCGYPIAKGESFCGECLCENDAAP